MDLINLFQQRMNEADYDAYIIPTSDFHSSEYISDYFKAREYLSGFTGSAGTLVVTRDDAYLWVDGRYFIQAEKQLEGRDIELMKIGEHGVPTIEEFLSKFFKHNYTLAFDHRLLPTKQVKAIIEAIPSNVEIKHDTELIDNVWPSRPALPFSLLYVLDTYFSGREYQDKLRDVKAKMRDYKVDMHILTTLDDIAWLYNLRGNDIKHTPVFLANAVITADESILFVDKNKINIEVKNYLDSNNIIVKDYNEFYDYLKTIKGKNILIDLNKANYLTYSSLSEDNVLIDKQNPEILMKSIKNPIEVKHLKNILAKDGAMVTKLMYYVKNRYENNEELSEISASDYVDNLRSTIDGYVDLSFDTISAFKDHAAMMHYKATEESNAKIDCPGLLLVDSGGHYLEGTSDITRTISVGKVPDKIKTHYTLVLKSVIALSEAVFLKGCNGQNLDILARGPIWKELIDYKCGTGHGVGYLLSVHEAPNGFRWKTVAERNDSAQFQVGMVTTNEPGIYLENEYGIRIENEMLCVEKGDSDFGEFLGFETITFAPIDLDCIKVSMLTKYEKEWLNQYHEMVYKKVNKYLTKAEKDWLKNYTRKI